LAKSRDYCMLVRQWVWFESQMCTGRLQWLLLGLAVESPWAALGGPFLSSYARMGLENGLLAM